MNIFTLFLINTIESLELFLLKRKIKKAGGFQGVWNNKTDEEILYSYEDATGWVDISFGITESETTIKIANTCIWRLEEYILPQMKKRGLPYK